ncbi:hypothetical protein [Streptomyces lydicus]|uniref:hypothetical protein n=1 Tax=Streptomyces lydicus TaxID=47763 RepID=UPI001F507FDD|nr:hypothetical protein [Streptomyces lydicus]
MGGLFGGLLGPGRLDLALDPDTLAAAGTALGCGAIRFLAPTSARSPSRPPPSPTYAEDFGDGRAFAEAAAAAGKPVVLLPAGRGAASARGAQSHTGALTTSADVVAAACRDAGVELVATPHEMTVVLATLHGGRRRATGPRTAVCPDGGGHGAIAADAAETAGLAVPELGPAAQQRLRTLLWEQSAVGNPVDLAGMGEQNPHSYGDTVAALLALDEADSVLLTGYFGGYSAATGGLGGPAAESGTAGGGSALAAGELETAQQMAVQATSAAKPLVVQSMFPDAPTAGHWSRRAYRCSPPPRTRPAHRRP